MSILTIIINYHVSLSIILLLLLLLLLLSLSTCRIIIISLGGACYFVTFIDDRSRWCKLYFLRAKAEVFENLQEFKCIAENQTTHKIKANQQRLRVLQRQNECFSQKCQNSAPTDHFTHTGAEQRGGAKESQAR